MCKAPAVRQPRFAHGVHEIPSIPQRTRNGWGTSSTSVRNYRIVITAVTDPR